MLSQAVLQQASTTSGIGQQALRQMLPVMAGMVVAGIVHVLVNQPPPAPAPPQRQAAPSVPDAGFAVTAFWTDWINHFTGTPDATSASASAPTPRPIKPVNAPPVELPKPQDAENESGAPFEAFQQMFQTGVQVQEQNAKAMQDIFEAFWSPSAESSVASDAEVPAKKVKGEQTPDSIGETDPQVPEARTRTGRRKVT